MSAELSNEFKETVRSQTDIVSLIGESVALHARGGGREFVGLCPFHDDHNPSLHVYPDRQTYRCWVCDEGGDCFSFVMKQDHVEFREALEILARRANVAIPKRRGRAGPAQDDRARLLEVLLWAERLFHRTLLEDPAAEPARRYLSERGFTGEAIRQFRLGYHPDDWEWVQKQARGTFPPQQLAAVCLVKGQEGGARYSDYFTDRVLFPIHNERGQPVGFGGRVLPGADDSFGKYFNSPESPVFHKSRLVYALSHARGGFKETGTAVVTEGYTDCITAHQAGLTNVVATLGTALTEQQVTTLKRFARKVVLVYDGDEAGQRAAERAVSRFLAQDVDLRILTLPAGQDPAEYLDEHGPESLQSMIDAAPEAFDFVFAALKGRLGVETVDGRQRILEETVTLLAGVPRLARNVREDLLLHRTAERLRVPEQTVRERYRDARKRAGSRRPGDGQQKIRVDVAETSEPIQRVLSGRPNRDDRLECEVIEALLAVPSLTGFVRGELESTDFRNPALRRIARSLLQISRDDEPFEFTQLLAALDDEPAIKSLAVRLDEQARTKQMADKLGGEDQTQQTTGDCPPVLRRSIDNLKWRREEQSYQQAAIKLSEGSEGAHALDRDTEEELLRQFVDFHSKRNAKRPAS